jgi:hypothetical protein
MRQVVRNFLSYFGRRRYKDWSDVPTGLVSLFAIVASMEAGYYGYVFQKVAPGFLDLANTQPLSTWLSAAFFACISILAAIGFQFFIWSVAAAGSVALLQKRFFGI